MYTEAQFEQLEQEEREITDEAILFMLLLLSNVKSDLEKELRDFYSKYGKDGVVTYTEARKWISGNDHRRRLTTLLVYIQTNFEELQEKLTPAFCEMLVNVIGKEVEFFKADPTDIVNESLDEKWGADDENWQDRLINDIALWCAYILMDIKQALLKGKTLEEVLAKLDKRFSTMEYVLTTLGLSESTAIGSMARRMIFKQLGISKYQFYTKADERTCEVCGSMHGLIFPMSAYEIGVTASPLHPRCRCWEVPIMD